MEFIDDRGLVNSFRGESHAENSPLWTLELILLKIIAGEDTTELKNALSAFYASCRIYAGLYNQRPDNNGTHEDYMSHDQLTAMFCFFFLIHREDICLEIWNEIKRQGGHYDNLNPDNPDRLLHPRDKIFYGHIVNDLGFFSFFHLTVFKIIIAESCASEYKVRPDIFDRTEYLFKNFKFFPKDQIRRMKKTDGKLLTFVRCYSTMDRDKKMEDVWEMATHRIYENDCFGNWNSVFSTYFTDKDHPIILLSERINFKKGELWD